jgi:hypothetical protein
MKPRYPGFRRIWTPLSRLDTFDVARDVQQLPFA